MKISIIFLVTILVECAWIIDAQDPTKKKPEGRTSTTTTRTSTTIEPTGGNTSTTIDPCNPEGGCSCPPNEVYSPCINPCGDFCTYYYYESQKCFPQCVQGCTCKKGYCRDPWSHMCYSIQWRMCQGNNEHYEDGVVNDCCTNECNEACPGTGPEVCEEPCGQGCFCDEGYYRHPVTKSCVELDCCPDVSNIECGENETFTCSNECLESCGNELKRCTDACEDGCWCDADHRRDPVTGLCVLPGDCSSTPPCGKNEVFVICGPCGGDYYCGMYAKCQTDACGPSGCVCDPEGDYCRDEQGNCVPRGPIILTAEEAEA